MPYHPATAQIILPTEQPSLLKVAKPSSNTPDASKISYSSWQKSFCKFLSSALLVTCAMIEDISIPCSKRQPPCTLYLKGGWHSPCPRASGINSPSSVHPASDDVGSYPLTLLFTLPPSWKYCSWSGTPTSPALESVMLRTQVQQWFDERILELLPPSRCYISITLS